MNTVEEPVTSENQMLNRRCFMCNHCIILPMCMHYNIHLFLNSCKMDLLHFDHCKTKKTGKGSKTSFSECINSNFYSKTNYYNRR